MSIVHLKHSRSHNRTRLPAQFVLSLATTTNAHSSIFSIHVYTVCNDLTGVFRSSVSPSPLLLIPLPCASLSACVSYSPTGWHEHSGHTEMMKGLLV